jgi:ADP-heptose:LPS heptosyltransferase
MRITRRLRDARCDEAIVLTSFHQCPLPTALLLRAAGLARIGAISDDYPGALLDIRHVVTDDIHEVERALSLVEAMGYRLPPGDDGLLRVPTTARPLRHVVVHPGASAPARTMSCGRWREIAAGLAFAGHRVVVTGSPAEAALVRNVAGGVGDPHVTRDLDELVEILEAATAVVVGNTGPAHLAAALGRPVVSCYPPTVPSVRWHPWGVPCVLLGDQSVPCAGCRARTCPQSRQWCVDRVTAADVVAAVDRVAGDFAQEGVA